MWLFDDDDVDDNELIMLINNVDNDVYDVDNNDDDVDKALFPVKSLYFLFFMIGCEKLCKMQI